VDGRVQFRRNWIASFQAITSSTRFQDGTSTAGPAYEASLLRNGRKLTYSAKFNDFSPGFRTDAGFAPRVDVREINQNISYRFRPEGKRFISWGPSFTSDEIWDHKNTSLEQTFTPKMTWEFVRSTEISVSYTDKRETLRPGDFSVLASNRSFSEHWQGLSFSTSYIRQVTFSGDVSRGAVINFVATTGNAPYLADYTSASIRAFVRPTVGLSVENSYLLTRLVGEKSGNGILTNHIVRSKWNYQFTKAMSIRTIVEYDSILSNPAFTSTQKTKRLNADFLITYLLHPGTAVYIGYNGTAEDLDRRLILTQSGYLRTGNRFINGDHQVFLKLSYLLRL
jgi:predicted porin